uniref:Uncharacterized protein n=1 Tax=Opuntia streptacantha TaxID=393608 RepID=A0A7C9ATP6_OPUST
MGHKVEKLRVISQEEHIIGLLGQARLVKELRSKVVLVLISGVDVRRHRRHKLLYGLMVQSLVPHFRLHSRSFVHNRIPDLHLVRPRQRRWLLLLRRERRDAVGDDRALEIVPPVGPPFTVHSVRHRPRVAPTAVAPSHRRRFASAGGRERRLDTRRVKLVGNGGGGGADFDAGDRRRDGGDGDGGGHGVDGEVGEENHDLDHKNGCVRENLLEKPDEGGVHLFLDSGKNPLQIFVE